MPPTGPEEKLRPRGPATALTILRACRQRVSCCARGKRRGEKEERRDAPFGPAHDNDAPLARLPAAPDELSEYLTIEEPNLRASRQARAARSRSSIGVEPVDEVVHLELARALRREDLELVAEEDARGRRRGVDDRDGGRGSGGRGGGGERVVDELVGGRDAGAADDLQEDDPFRQLRSRRASRGNGARGMEQERRTKTTSSQSWGR